MSDQIAIWGAIVIAGALIYATGWIRGYNEAVNRSKQALFDIHESAIKKMNLSALAVKQKAFIKRLKKKTRHKR